MPVECPGSMLVGIGQGATDRPNELAQVRVVSQLVVRGRAWRSCGSAGCASSCSIFWSRASNALMSAVRYSGGMSVTVPADGTKVAFVCDAATHRTTVGLGRRPSPCRSL